MGGVTVVEDGVELIDLRTRVLELQQVLGVLASALSLTPTTIPCYTTKQKRK